MPIQTESIHNYTMGALHSKQEFQFGYFEIRCRFPHADVSNPDPIRGISPSFWLWDGRLPDPICSPPYEKKELLSEIDIFECYGWSRTDYENGNYDATQIINEWTSSFF